MSTQKPQFVIRPFESVEDHRQCERIQAITWSEDEVIRSNITLALARHGSLALGAFIADGTMIGMAFSFLATTHFHGANHGLSHHSHMAAVLPEYRGMGVGESLKREQAKRLMAQGINLMTWTYDPLEAKNANLNINRLGCICRTFIENCYGEMSDALNAGLPTDRFEVEWWLDGRWEGKAPRESANGPHNATGEAIYIPIPLDFQAIKRQDLAQAKEIRLATRRQFEAAFAEGYAVTAFRREAHHGAYVLQPYAR